MANRILLTTEELISEANELDKAIKSNEDMVQQCDSVVTGLLSYWQGEAQSRFVDSWRTKKSAIVKTTAAAKDLAKKIRVFADRMAQADKRAAQSGGYLANV